MEIYNMSWADFVLRGRPDFKIAYGQLNYF